MTEISTRPLSYYDGDLECRGYLALPAASAGSPKSIVVINHAWAGQTAFEQQKARALAGLGYAALALDNYGEGRTGSGPEENGALMNPLMADRAALRARLLAGIEAARGVEEVEGDAVGAIGFCFGGLCALDMARSGADLRGVVAFHGLLTPSGLAPEKVRAKVLALHGYDDPLAPPEALLAFAKEMSEAGADWQLHAYGGTLHAFTNPVANQPDAGLLYSPRADARSWQSMKSFFDEILD